jgi:hypothetical protein
MWVQGNGDREINVVSMQEAPSATLIGENRLPPEKFSSLA